MKLMKNATEGCNFISLSRSDQKATEGEKKDISNYFSGL